MTENADAWVPPSAWRVILMAAFLVIASSFDAWMTIEFIAIGGEEGNPLVIPYLELGAETFIAWKTVVGVCAATALALGCRMKRWIWLAFNVVVWTYVAITFLHIFILVHLR